MNNPCANLAALQSNLQKEINKIQTQIALDEAGLANDDPGFPTWDMAGVIGRIAQLQPGSLADRYGALLLLLCQLAGYQTGGAAITATQKFGGCLNSVS